MAAIPRKALKDCISRFNRRPDHAKLSGNVSDPQLPPSCDVANVRVKAVINLYGPADLILLYRSSGSPRYIRDRLNQYVGGSERQYPERYRALSPITYVGNGIPPTITFLGRNDHIIPREQADRLENALSQAGVIHETYLLPMTDHGFDANLGGLNTQFTRYKVREFLRLHG
jgi:dipeptidyl aminopeptidase/acylaminoacyl peptidase